MVSPFPLELVHECPFAVGELVLAIGHGELVRDVEDRPLLDQLRFHRICIRITELFLSIAFGKWVPHHQVVVSAVPARIYHHELLWHRSSPLGSKSLRYGLPLSRIFWGYTFFPVSFKLVECFLHELLLLMNFFTLRRTHRPHLRLVGDRFLLLLDRLWLYLIW